MPSIFRRMGSESREIIVNYYHKVGRSDVISGGSVALLEIPQSIACALMAGLPIVYGVYSSIVVAMIYALVGGSRHMICGPTNSSAIVIASTLSLSHLPEIQQNPAMAVAVLTFLVGFFQFLFGVFKLGVLAQFISRSVLIGYATGAGILIVSNQIPKLLGLGSGSFGDVWSSMMTSFDLTNPIHGINFLLALWTAGFVWICAKRLPRFPASLVALVLSATAVWVANLDHLGIAVVGTIPHSLPSWVGFQLSFDLFHSLAQGAMAIAILGCVESVSISKNISLQTGDRPASNRDFIGMGVAHIIGAFFRCMPGSCSFTRSELNVRLGAQTRMSAIISASCVALILITLAPAATYIPMASLAGLLIVLGSGLIQWSRIRMAIFATRSDAVVFGITLISVLLLPLDMAIFVGVLSSFVLFLRKVVSPRLVEYAMDDGGFREIHQPSERSHPAISIIHVEGELFFGAAELFEDQVREMAADPRVRVVILRMKNARHLDLTAVMALESLHEYLVAKGRNLLISGITEELLSVFRRAELDKKIGAENIFLSEENLTNSTRKALMKARQILGGVDEPDIRVFYDANKAGNKLTSTAVDEYVI